MKNLTMEILEKNQLPPKIMDLINSEPIYNLFNTIYYSFKNDFKKINFKKRRKNNEKY